MKKIQKPVSGEYAPYASMYIDLVPADGLVLQHLSTNLQVVKDLVSAQSEEKLTTPCAEGEWTIKEILLHVIDTERIYAYRALRFARGDTTNLPGFDQNVYAASSGANQRTTTDLLDELTAVRMATLTLFNGLTAEAMLASGSANGHPLSVRAAAYQIAGHELHHLASIRENYL